MVLFFYSLFTVCVLTSFEKPVYALFKNTP